MTPKEKALDLTEKMNVIHYVKLGGKNEKSKGLPISMRKDQIIQCALNCVDEIIIAFWHTHKNEEEYRYWQEVKEEIEKLFKCKK